MPLYPVLESPLFPKQTLFITQVKYPLRATLPLKQTVTDREFHKLITTHVIGKVQ